VTVDPEQHRLVEPAALALDDLVADLGEEPDDPQGEQEARGQLDGEHEAEPPREAAADLFAKKLSAEHAENSTPVPSRGARIILSATG